MDFPDPMPPVSPTMSTAGESTEHRLVIYRAPGPPGAVTRPGGALRIRFTVPTNRVKPNVSARTQRRRERTVARRNAPEGFGRLAAALASTDDAAPRIESRLIRLIVTTRWVTIVAGFVFGILRDSKDHYFWAGAVVLVVLAVVQTLFQLQPAPTLKMRSAIIGELAITVSISMATGGLASPFVLTPVTGLLLAGYVWGRRATVGTAIAGVIAASSTILLQTMDATDRRSAGQVAVVYLLCGALGAFTRNLIAEIESHRAAAIDQAAEMATANELLVSLHTLAQTLPASFDLPEVVDSMRLRLRTLLRFSSLVVLVRDDARVGVDRRAGRRRAPARRASCDGDLPQPLQRALTSEHPVLIDDRLVSRDEDGFAALARSGLYTALRARGALVGLIALEDVTPNVYGPEQRDLLESLSSLLALSIDNARWFGRLRTLGAEAERARIARELHDRVAQSLAYVAFELERMHALPGDKDAEISELRVVVRDIVRELRQTIYQLRANVSEDADIVEVAEQLPRAVLRPHGHPDAAGCRRRACRFPTGSSRSCGGSGRRRS